MAKEKEIRTCYKCGKNFVANVKSLYRTCPECRLKTTTNVIGTIGNVLSSLFGGKKF